jgi:tRNA/rRNA methyltransferase
MNLAQAVAVTLYELARQGRVPRGRVETQLAESAEVDRITGLLFEVLCASGYVKPRAAADTEQKLRRLVRRLNLDAGDAEVWTGMLRQIRWRVGR